MKVNIGKFPKNSDRRKIEVEIEDFDTWSLDHTLANIIYPALIQLKNTKNGVPSSFVDIGGEDYTSQLSFDFYMETRHDHYDEAAAQWDIVLDKMIWAFGELLKDNYTEKYQHGIGKYDFVKTDKKFFNSITQQYEESYVLEDKNPGEHWHDYEGEALHEKRIQEGIELFAKYYRNLWD